MEMIVQKKVTQNEAIKEQCHLAADKGFTIAYGGKGQQNWEEI